MELRPRPKAAVGDATTRGDDYSLQTRHGSAPRESRVAGHLSDGQGLPREPHAARCSPPPARMIGVHCRGPGQRPLRPGAPAAHPFCTWQICSCAIDAASGHSCIVQGPVGWWKHLISHRHCNAFMDQRIMQRASRRHRKSLVSAACSAGSIDTAGQ